MSQVNVKQQIIVTFSLDDFKITTDALCGRLKNDVQKQRALELGEHLVTQRADHLIQQAEVGEGLRMSIEAERKKRGVVEE